MSNKILSHKVIVGEEEEDEEREEKRVTVIKRSNVIQGEEEEDDEDESDHKPIIPPKRTNVIIQGEEEEEEDELELDNKSNIIHTKLQKKVVQGEEEEEDEILIDDSNTVINNNNNNNNNNEVRSSQSIFGISERDQEYQPSPKLGGNLSQLPNTSSPVMSTEPALSDPSSKSKYDAWKASSSFPLPANPTKKGAPQTKIPEKSAQQIDEIIPSTESGRFLWNTNQRIRKEIGERIAGQYINLTKNIRNVESELKNTLSNAQELSFHTREAIQDLSSLQTNLSVINRVLLSFPGPPNR